jgi:hypothetical protein
MRKMRTTHISPAGNEISDTDVFAIRLFVFTETNGECSLPINSILKLVDIFEVINDKELSA